MQWIRCLQAPRSGPGVAGQWALALLWALGCSPLPTQAAASCPWAWSDAVVVSTPGAQLNFEPRVAINSAGLAIAIWTEMDPDYTEHVLTARRPAGGSWEAPVEVGRTSGSATDPFPSEVDIAVGDGGHAIATWRRQILAGDSSPRVATFDPATGWSTPVDLTLPGIRFQQAASVDINASGQAVAAWWSSGRVHARLFDPSTGWGPPRSIIPNGGQFSTPLPRARINASGQVALVWQAPMAWAMRIDPVTGAEPPVRLIADGSVDFRRPPELALADSGDIFVTWSHLAPRADILEVLVAHYRPGAGWSPALRLSNPLVQAVEPDVAVNSRGEAVVAWNRPRPPNTARLEGAAYTPRQGWVPTRPISPDRAPLGFFDLPYAHLSDSGLATATAWWYSGTGDFRLESYSARRPTASTPALTVLEGLGGNQHVSGAANNYLAAISPGDQAGTSGVRVRVREPVCPPTR